VTLFSNMGPLHEGTSIKCICITVCGGSSLVRCDAAPSVRGHLLKVIQFRCHSVHYALLPWNSYVWSYVPETLSTFSLKDALREPHRNWTRDL
jgi:hypothetical protein